MLLVPRGYALGTAAKHHTCLWVRFSRFSWGAIGVCMGRPGLADLSLIFGIGGKGRECGSIPSICTSNRVVELIGPRFSLPHTGAGSAIVFYRGGWRLARVRRDRSGCNECGGMLKARSCIAARQWLSETQGHPCKSIGLVSPSVTRIMGLFIVFLYFGMTVGPAHSKSSTLHRLYVSRLNHG